MFETIKDRAKAFVERPYDDDMDVTGWVLFIGLWVVVSVGWVTVLNKIKE